VSGLELIDIHGGTEPITAHSTLSGDGA
jgi:hypothetical protein